MNSIYLLDQNTLRSRPWVLKALEAVGQYLSWLWHSLRSRAKQKIFTQPQKELSGARKIRRRLTESNTCAREWLLTEDRGEHVDCREWAPEDSGKSRQGGDARQALWVSTSVSCLPAVPEVDAAVSLMIIFVSSTLPPRTLSSSS